MKTRTGLDSSCRNRRGERLLVVDPRETRTKMQVSGMYPLGVSATCWSREKGGCLILFPVGCPDSPLEEKKGWAVTQKQNRFVTPSVCAKSMLLCMSLSTA